MKRLLALLLASTAASWSPGLGGIAVASTSKAATAKSPSKRTTPKAATINYKDLAPADEYFGPLKLSILGIKNTTSDTGKRYVFGMRDANATMATASFIDASLHDWARKYPRDREVARALYFLQRLYAMIDSDAAKAKAKSEASWMYASYGTTPQARALRKVLAAAPVYATPPATAASAPAPDASNASPAPAELPLQPGAAPAATGTGFPAPVQPSAAQIDGTPSSSPATH